MNTNTSQDAIRKQAITRNKFEICGGTAVPRALDVPRRSSRCQSRAVSSHWFRVLSTAVVLGLSLATLTGSAASALWSDATGIRAVTVTAGDLRLDLDGPPMLHAPGQTTAPVLLMPGEDVYITQQATTTTLGDNLDAELTVTVNPDPALGFSIAGHFTVTDQDGRRVVAPTPLGQAATLPATSGDSASWLVEVVAVVEFDPWTSDVDNKTRPQVAMGELEVGLRQTRTGFDPADLSDPARTERGQVSR